jgi:glycosyltransferase involved in cell wall biosynthesis
MKTMKKSFKADCKFIMILFGLFLAPFFTLHVNAQLYNFTEEQMISFTAKNPYSRFPGGRPLIPAAILDTIRKMDIQVVEAIGSIPKEYANQYEDGWKSIIPGKKLVGRAFTVQFMPSRPDLVEGMQSEADKNNFTGLLFVKDNFTSLKNVIKKFLYYKNLKQKFTINCYEIVKKKYNINEMVNNFFKIVKKLEA